MQCISIPCSFRSEVSKLCISNNIIGSLFISPSGMLCLFTCLYAFYFPQSLCQKMSSLIICLFHLFYQAGLIFFFYFALIFFFPSLWQQDNGCWLWTKVSEGVFSVSFISKMSPSGKKDGLMDMHSETWISYLVLPNASYWRLETNLEVWSNCS